MILLSLLNDLLPEAEKYGRRMEQGMAALATTSSQSSSTEILCPGDPARPAGDSPPFWPTNGNGGQQPQQPHDSPESLSESLAQVSLSSSSSSHSAARSPVSVASFAATPSALLGSGSSSYWSTVAGCDTADSSFLNGSSYSPGYSSGGSSSGSPQSPLTRPQSRPITGVKPAHIQPTGMFYPKTQCPDKQGWKGGQNVWAPYPGPKPAVLPNMAQNMVGQNFGQKEKEWKDSSRITSSQYPQHQQQQHVPFATSGFRQSLNSLPRPGSIGGGGGRPVMQQQQQQQPQQQDGNWQVGPGGWGASLNFHAARKFGRRRGNARSNTLIHVTSPPAS